MMWIRMRVLFLALLVFAKGWFTDEQQPPYRSIEVRFSNPDAPGIDLAGTLTEPLSGGPFSAAVLIAGAGPSQENIAIDGNPYLEEHFPKLDYIKTAKVMP